MKLTIHEIAQVVGAKNDISIFEDTQLEKAEFDSRLIGTEIYLCHLKVRVMAMTLLKQPLKMVQQ